MPKKSSSKKATQIQDNEVVVEKIPISPQKKVGTEIDEIFAGKKRKKSEPEKAEKPNGDATVNPEKKKKTKRDKRSDDGGFTDATVNPKKMKKNKRDKGSDEGGFMDPPSRPRTRTNDGLAIFTEEELGISKADAGGTPLCPFDCSCCF